MENKTTNNPEFLSDKEQGKDTENKRNKQALKPVIGELKKPETFDNHINSLKAKESIQILSSL